MTNVFAAIGLFVTVGIVANSGNIYLDIQDRLKVKRIISEKLGVKRRKIRMGKGLQETFPEEADSITIYYILWKIQEEFNVQFENLHSAKYPGLTPRKIYRHARVLG